jgi:hypothetical protein
MLLFSEKAAKSTRTIKFTAMPLKHNSCFYSGKVTERANSKLLKSIPALSVLVDVYVKPHIYRRGILWSQLEESHVCSYDSILLSSRCFCGIWKAQRHYHPG